MAYDIPDEIKYKEKIIANLDSKQLLYAIFFGITAFISYKLPFEGEARMIVPSLLAILGIGFIFLNVEQKIGDVIAYYKNIRRSPHNSRSAQRFFEIKEIKDDLLFLENGKLIAVLKIEPINFMLLDEDRKKVLLENYKSFLNHLGTGIQILVRTMPIKIDHYFDNFKPNERKDILELYSDFSSFERDFAEKSVIRKRHFYIIIPFRKKNSAKQDVRELEGIIKIMQEKLIACGLDNKRLKNEELMEFLLSYSSLGNAEHEEIKMKKNEISNDLFKSVITPSFDIQSDHAKVNGEFHRIVKVTGYPRKVEDGWLQSFLSKNEGYDISIHIDPSTIRHMLVYLHNQIIQQASDLMTSTMKGTPNPALEIKKSDTMRVYDSLYKGEEKLFYVSLYIDNKEEDIESLNLLTEKCKANLNSMLMIPSPVKWRTADALKSTIPIANDKLETRKEFLTSSLTATFPFISPVDSREKGTLFAHELETSNPVFLDFEEMSNKHFFVIGISGSGKSYTSKYLLMQQLFKEETKIYVLDPNGEYSGLCRKLGGQTIKLSRESDSIINLFDLAGDDFGNKLLGLISAFDILVGGLTESQKSILGKALSKVYRKKGIYHEDSSTWHRKYPTFSDLKQVLNNIREQMIKNKEYLQDPSVESLLNRVEMYCDGGIFGFLDKHTKIEVSNNFACFDLSSLPNAVKPLCMFMVLDLIKNEVKKDLKAKVVLIDEGWALLKSKEAENYILEFIKTSRKYNAGIGFVTQEIEDLLNSQTGKSILNTASTKILMRQNSSNIQLISKVLNLNKQMENYLLTAQRGYGLIISETGRYKFSVSASPKINALLTTDPNELNKREKKEEKKAEKKQRKKLDKGLYLKSELSEEEIFELIKDGYVECKERLTQFGGSSIYLVKRRGNESAEHAFLVWSTYYAAKKKFKHVEKMENSSPDVLIKIKDEKIGFEIETGSNLEKMGVDRLKERFDNVRKDMKEMYIIVSSKTEKTRYSNFGTAFTRNEIESLMDKLSHTYNMDSRTCKKRTK